MDSKAEDPEWKHPTEICELNYKEASIIVGSPESRTIRDGNAFERSARYTLEKRLLTKPKKVFPVNTNSEPVLGSVENRFRSKGLVQNPFRQIENKVLWTSFLTKRFNNHTTKGSE